LANRSRKFISGTDVNSNKYGKLNIANVKFSMPDYTAGVNFPTGTSQVFKGEIKFEGDKVKMGATSTFSPIVKNINVVFDTDAAGLSTISSCVGTPILGSAMMKQGFVLIPACNSNNCCVTLTFPTPFPNQLLSLVVTPEFQDYGSTNAAITSGFRNQTAAGADLCFDHIGNSITNGPYKAYWIAIGQ